jgi:hypothetical protein
MITQRAVHPEKNISAQFEGQQEKGKGVKKNLA